MFHANGGAEAAYEQGMGAKLDNPLTGDVGQSATSSLNQQYKEQVASGAFQGSFADFMKHLSINNVIDTGYNLADSVRKLFSKTAGQTITEPIVIEEPASSMKDMTKWLIGVGVVTLIVWGGVVMYKKYKAGK